MTKYSLLLAVLALCCLAVPAGAQPTVNNGDFETGADMFNTFPGYLGHFGGAGSYPAGDNPSEIPGWDSHKGGCGVVPGSTEGPPGSAFDPKGAFRDNGTNKTNVAFLQGNASITQTITGFVVGTTYQLDFDYNARMDGNCCGTAGGHDPNFTVTLQDQDLSRHWSYDDSFVPAVDFNGAYNNPWYHGRIVFRPDQDTLDLIVSSDTGGLDGTALIDNITLSVFTP
jgi:hypothetical protein